MSYNIFLSKGNITRLKKYKVTDAIAKGVKGEA
jgi:hypothetical protein